MFILPNIYFTKLYSNHSIAITITIEDSNQAIALPPVLRLFLLGNRCRLPNRRASINGKMMERQRMKETQIVECVSRPVCLCAARSYLQLGGGLVD